jgi:FkbM family methyltransferase
MTPYVALDHRGDVFLLPTSIGSKVFAIARRPEFVVLGRACVVLRTHGMSGGETLIDVGAHIGTTTVPALSREGFGRAIAIEPDPAHLPLLRANIALNRLDDRVTVIPAAISETAGEYQPFSPGFRAAGDRWMKGRLTNEPSAITVEVPTVTLDGLADDSVVDPSAAGLLWFDCAGSEEAALASASRFLERRIPVVLPLRHRHISEPNGLMDLLGRVYNRVVDLRSPRLSTPLADWSPLPRRLDDLAGLVPAKQKLTDALFFYE